MNFNIWPRKIIGFLIQGYQKTFSLDHGPLKKFFPHGYCKFYPSCSEYMRQAIETKGVLRGFPKGLWRILKCNPFSKGGNDPLT